MRGNVGRSYLLLAARAVSLGRPAILFRPVGVLVQPVGDLIRNLRAPSKEGPQTSYRTQRPAGSSYFSTAPDQSLKPPTL